METVLSSPAVASALSPSSAVGGAGSGSPANEAAVALLREAIAGLGGPGYRVGVAAAAIGEQTSFSAGQWSVGEAWSSIKVPLAIAALQAGSGLSLGNGRDSFPYGSCSHTTSAERAILSAITVSDNCAAWQLWEGLGGDGSQAAGRVTSVLRSGGDDVTTVKSVGDGTRLTSGMTQWSLADQATFAAHLAALPGVAPVWVDMGLAKGDASAAAGLNMFSGAHTKAGWGSASPGGSVTRQFGVISVGPGICSAVAIGTDRSGDAFSTLTAIAQAIKSNLTALPTGPCPASM